MKFQVAVITLLFALYMVKLSMASVQKEVITPGFQGSQMDYIDNYGFFLLSKDTTFAFGFITFTSTDTTSYLLAVVHQASSQTVWSANPNNPITHSDDFIFSKNGDAYLKSGELTIWSTNTSNAASMQLLNSGNLVILSSGDSSAAPLWESFIHPTNTLLSGQSFTKETTLVSKPNAQNITYSLSIDSLDMNLFLNFNPPQQYWSMQQDTRKIVNQITGDLQSAIIVNNSWTFYNNRGSVLWQFVFTQDTDVSNASWAAVLNNKGVISFINLESSGTSSAIKIPQDPCQSPDACNPYMICYSGSMCTCPEILNSQTNCNPNLNPNGASNCSISGDDNLVKLGDGVEYFATKFMNPFMKTNLTSCKNACVNNCSCVAVFYENNSGSCYIFNQIASLQQLDTNGNNNNNISNYLSFIKISSSINNNDTKGSKNHQLVIIIVITLGAVILIAIIIITGLKIKIHRKRKVNLHEPGSPHHHSSSDDEDNIFLEAMSTNPVRFTYKELEYATNNFEIKLGQGGFGSVYLGKLQDGSQIAVKKLEGIGQGKKEFRAEVSIIGSIHHVHLVKLRGFCAEGNYRLLAYEYMSNGSLDKWIFKSGTDKTQTQTQTLNLNQRFNIALGTAKGLHYLHEDCDSKIIHCDIKPENVLLDSNFTAKVSDFGLAKLMNREQSNVFTTLRGTRGYLAPEWIMNYAISEKSDVYSFGMVLLEIIGGRKSFEVRESGEKMYFPSYAHKMLEEGNVSEVVDETLRDDKDIETQERMIKVALWCIQEDLSMRPSMSKVVQMLEGASETMPKLPPVSGTHMGFRLYKNAINSSSEEAMTSDTGSGQTDHWNSDAMLSAVRLSGPR